MVALRDGAEWFAVDALVAVQPQTPFAHQLSIECRDGLIAGKFDQTLQVEVVIFGSLLAPTALDFQMFDKVTDQLRKIVCSHSTIISGFLVFCDMYYNWRVSIFEAIILGIIQGLTEFIPISSSGHLVIAQYFMSGASSHLFLEWINIGTVLALLIYFRSRITEILRAAVQGRDLVMIRNILIAMLPAGIIGYLAADMIESNPFFSSPWTVVVTLAGVGVLLVVLERLPKLSPLKAEEQLSSRRALLIGLAQVAALIPGTSRSGSTIIAGRLMGLSAARAAEFSFLVSIPIMLGVLTKLLVKDADRAYLVQNFDALLWGNLAALVSGLLAVGFLMRYLEKHPLAVFGWYRIGLAVVLLSVLLLQ